MDVFAVALLAFIVMVLFSLFHSLSMRTTDHDDDTYKQGWVMGALSILIPVIVAFLYMVFASLP